MVRRRRAAVLRLDIAATVSSTARDLGPQGHTGHGADHRCERQAGAVRCDHPADCAPGRAHPSTCRRRRCPGILARDTTPLPRRQHDLAPRRPGQRAYRCAHPDAGRSARHPVSLVAHAGPATEPHGPTLARREAAHRRQSAGRLGGCSGQQRRGLGTGTDTPAGAPQGRDDIAALLAQEPGTRLLATYLAGDLRQRAMALIGERYSDFGPTLAAEMLAAHHGLTVSRETLRHWMAGAVAKAVGNRVQRLRRDDGTASGSEVNHALGRWLTQGLPAIDLAHADLA